MILKSGILTLQSLMETGVLLLDDSALGHPRNGGPGIIFFFFWPYPRHVFQCLGYEILSGMGFQINWYYMAFLQLSSWSRCIFYFISLTSTVSSGRVLRRGRPGSTVLTGVRRAAVNRIVPLALVHNLYTPLVTACQGFILF